MQTDLRPTAVLSLLFFATFQAACQSSPAAGSIPLTNSDHLDVRDVDTAVHQHRGKAGLSVRETTQGRGVHLVVVRDLVFQDGTIEVELSGAPRADAAPGMRGSVGIAFRLQESEGGDPTYECIYLRPTNGRAPDQIRRNHSTQYISSPEHPWHRLRKESPGKYESYVDLEAGVWTRMRIDVSDTTAKLYVHDSEQPCLVVNDLKHGSRAGQVALWVGTGTQAWFRNLRVQPLTRSPARQRRRSP